MILMNICRKYHSRLKNGETISDNQIKYLNNDGDKDCIRFVGLQCTCTCNAYSQCKRILQGTHGSLDVVICSQSLLNLNLMFTYNANEFCKDYIDHLILFFVYNLRSIHLVCM